MRNLYELTCLNHRVYIYAGYRPIVDRLLRDLDEAGFTFEDGTRASEHEFHSIIQLNPDCTLSEIGGKAYTYAFGSKDESLWKYTDEVSEDDYVVRIDYRRLLAGLPCVILNGHMITMYPDKERQTAQADRLMQKNGRIGPALV